MDDLRNSIKNLKKDIKKKNAGLAVYEPQLLSAINKLPTEDKTDFCKKLAESTFKAEKIIMEEAFKEGIITKEEYEKRFKHKYITKITGYEIDSFPEFIQTVLYNKRHPNEPIMAFTTPNEKILNDRKRLEKRFNVKIMSVEEALKKLKEIQNHEKIDYLEAG